MPIHIDDDWFWMYAAVLENRKKPAFVVTNDLMRDHRVAFLAPRPFIRWRMSHVVHFDFSSGVDDYSNSVPECFLYEPSRFSREIQRTGPSGRWHIPATDKPGWLCLDGGAAHSHASSDVSTLTESVHRVEEQNEVGASLH